MKFIVENISNATAIDGLSLNHTLFEVTNALTQLLQMLTVHLICFRGAFSNSIQRPTLNEAIHFSKSLIMKTPAIVLNFSLCNMILMNTIVLILIWTFSLIV